MQKTLGNYFPMLRTREEVWKEIKKTMPPPSS